MIEVEHLCMTLRGVQAAGSRTVSSALHGLLRDSPGSRQEFFALTGCGIRARPVRPATAPPQSATITTLPRDLS